MADFFTDSDDEKELKDILSQAMDMAILEQVAAINNAASTNSHLPSHLETRFQNLKSFQSNNTKPTSLPTQSFNLSSSLPFKKSDCANKVKNSDLKKGDKKFEQRGKEFEQCLNKSPETITCLSSSNSSDKRGNLGKKEKKSHFWEGFSKLGCFLCYSSKVSRGKCIENGGFDWWKHDKFSSDLSVFSVKNQQKMMKKAMKEEEKICRDAEKIVKWVKHASLAMDVSDIAK